VRPSPAPDPINSQFAARHWYRFSALSALLYPVSLLFRVAVRVRFVLYRLRLLRSTRMPVPVIVVGNLTVGGTGKTPLVLWLARNLREQGRRPGVIASGYGGERREPAAVTGGDDPRISGDEAVLLAIRAGTPVWSGSDRVRAANALLRAHPECDLLICDDGLQHYRLARDLEIAVEDARGFGNGCMLPAGPLREPATRRVDARVINATVEARGILPPDAYRMRLEPAGLYRLDQQERTVDASVLRGKRLHAVAGIGDPGRFFASLDTLGLAATAHAFADHHDYAEHELVFENCDAVLMTEKDAVKCKRFTARNDLYALRVEASLDPGFAQFLEKWLHGLKAS
jgi:tetraacyldisaccharide 4'-kinase